MLGASGANSSVFYLFCCDFSFCLLRHVQLIASNSTPPPLEIDIYIFVYIDLLGAVSYINSEIPRHWRAFSMSLFIYGHAFLN